MEEAARLFRRAAELRPDDIFAPMILVGIERGLERFEEALATARLSLERADKELERYPESSCPAFASAMALAVLGDREAAVRRAEHALAMEPDDHPTEYNAACVYSLLGEVDRALDLLGSVGRKGRESPLTLCMLDGLFRRPAAAGAVA